MIKLEDFFYRYRKLYSYSKFCKKGKRQFQHKILTQLEILSENDPKQYWNLVNELKESNSDSTYPSLNISPEKL
jgi:hypothetical protein